MLGIAALAGVVDEPSRARRALWLDRIVENLAGAARASGADLNEVFDQRERLDEAGGGPSEARLDGASTADRVK